MTLSASTQRDGMSVTNYQSVMYTSIVSSATSAGSIVTLAKLQNTDQIHEIETQSVVLNIIILHRSLGALRALNSRFFLAQH